MKVLKRTKNATRSDQTKTTLVQLEYLDSQADSVCVSGTFNNWHPSATPMTASVHGHWKKDLELPPGTYEYALVVDGHRWVPDPRCQEKVENSFGGLNSVLKVPPRGNGTN